MLHECYVLGHDQDQDGARIVVQSLSQVQLFATPWTAARQSSLSIINSQSLLKLISIESVMPSIQPSHPLSSPPHPAFNLSQHQGLFQMRHFFASSAKVLGVSALASVLPMNIQDWFPLGLTGLISLQSKGLSRVFSNTTVQKHQFFGPHTSIHDYWKNHSFVGNVSVF